MTHPYRSARARAVQGLRIAVIGACLTASCLQASELLQQFASTTVQHVTFGLVAAALLVGSLVLSHTSGELLRARAPSWLVLLCLVTVVLVELFSVGTSSSGFSTRMLATEQAENASSAEATSARATVQAYRDQVVALRAEAAALPENYRTRRGEILAQASALLPRIERAERRAADVSVSATGQAMDSLEAAIGLSGAHLALLAACLLSLVPAVLLVAGAALHGPREAVELDVDEEADAAPGKGRAGPQLHAVR